MLNKSHQILLTIDGLINLFIGVVLLLYPLGSAEWLGLPRTEHDFYPTILGGILLGIGIALLIERFGHTRKIRGLSLPGAIAINFCGATVLLIWLLFYPLTLPLRGQVLLWIIVLLVYGIGFTELLSNTRHDQQNI